MREIGGTGEGGDQVEAVEHEQATRRCRPNWGLAQGEAEVR